MRATKMVKQKRVSAPAAAKEENSKVEELENISDFERRQIFLLKLDCLRKKLKTYRYLIALVDSKPEKKEVLLQSYHELRRQLGELINDNKEFTRY